LIFGFEKNIASAWFRQVYAPGDVFLCKFPGIILILGCPQQGKDLEGSTASMERSILAAGVSCCNLTNEMDHREGVLYLHTMK
jgi:hypothetical protein